VTICLGGLMVAAVAIVWLSLLLRKALLLFPIVLAPLAFAGSAWDVTRGWVGKWAAFVLALIVSKLVLVVVFLVAITQMATPIEADLTAITEPITGIVMLAIAAFAPYMVYRVIAFLGFDLYNTMGAEQESKNAMNRPVPIPSKPSGGEPKKVLDDDGGGGNPPGGGGGGGGNPPPPGGGGGGGNPPPPGGGSAGTGAGASGSSAAAGGSSAAAGAGPAAAVVVGAEVAKKAAAAGPKAGKQAGGHAEAAADGANQNPNASSGSGPSPQAPPPRTPPPNTPSGPPAGSDTTKPPHSGKE